MKTCTLCKIDKPITEFHKQKLGKDGLRSRCKPCESSLGKIWRQNNPDKNYNKIHPNYLKTYHKDIGRYKRYSLSKEEFYLILKKQNNCCAICSRSNIKRWCIDHDHNCCSTSSKSCGKCVRGIICSYCNTALGWYENNQQSIIRYLAALA